MEQTLGHVAYGLGLRRALAKRTDFESRWMDVPFIPEQLKRVPLIGRNWTIRGSIRAARALRAQTKQEPLDALFLHTQTIGLFSAPYISRIPTLMSVDATPINYDELAEFYGAKVHAAPFEKAKLLAHRAVMRRVKRFTTWSEWAKRSLVRDYGVPAEKVTVIHPGTAVSIFPKAHERPLRRPGPLRVLFVGGDFVRKGGDLLVAVARERLRNRVELNIVTTADVAPGNGVSVHRGMKPLSPELLALYADADVFVLPTRGDCLAMVLGEAMAASLPIITTRVGAHAEAVEDGGSGYLINVDDADALADRLSRMADSPELILKLGARSRTIGEQRFDMEKNANRIADILLGKDDSALSAHA